MSSVSPALSSNSLLGGALPLVSAIPTSRVSDLYLQQQTLNDVENNQSSLSKLEQELATGNALSLPSDNPNAADRGIAINGILERYTQVGTNLSSAGNYLNATSSTLQNVATLLAGVRSTALGAIGSTATAADVSTAAESVKATIQEMLQLANTNFNGRYLFAGSATGTTPFIQTTGGIVYNGNSNVVQTYSDLNTLIGTNVSGNESFGAVSLGVEGTTNLIPALEYGTPLADLRGGQGISQGSIAISNGTSTSTIDLSHATTIGDVARLIESNPPSGSTITADVTSTGLNLQLSGPSNADLTVSEVGGGTVAAELGILNTSGSPTTQITGGNLDPTLQLTTPLAGLLGTSATAYVPSGQLNSNLIFQADQNGTQYNGATINFVDDSKLQAGPGLTAGNETAQYNAAATPATASLALPGASNDLILTATTPGTAYNGVNINIATQAGLGDSATASYDSVNKVLTLTVDDSGQTSTQALIDAIGSDGTFTAARDSSAETNASGGFVPATAAGTDVANTYNSGGNANTLFVYIQPGATTANDVIHAVDATGVFSASLDPSQIGNNGTGPIYDSWTNPATTGTTSGGSGSNLDLASGLQLVNGGKTFTIDASGAKTVNDLLNDINSSGASVQASINQQGTGIMVQSLLSGSNFYIGENGGNLATQLGLRTLTLSTPLSALNNGAGVQLNSSGPDLVVTSAAGGTVSVSLTGAQTIGDVINDINSAAQTAGVPIIAQLATQGNGIQLIDNDPSGNGTLSVAAGTSGNAISALGFLSAAGTPATPTSAVAASATVSASGANNDLVITGNPAGPGLNGATVQFVNTGGGPSVNYNAGSQTLTFDVDPTTTTANDLIALVQGNASVSQNFTLSLSNTDPGNTGNGTLGSLPGSVTLAGGAGQTLTSADTNPTSPQGVFSALLNLQSALQAGNTTQIQAAVNSLDAATTAVNAAQADVGFQLQFLGTLSGNLSNTQVQLKSAASDDLDADLTQVISDMLGQQTAYQASLQATGLISKLSLLNYI